MAEPQWMTIARAEEARGVAEVPGTPDNPRILEYQKTANMQLDDETPWCSAFANWCVKQAGIAGTRKGNARSWRTWGQALDVPRVGAVVVFWRDDPNSAKGHVAFYVRNDGTNIWVLGGNQGNRVSVAVPDGSRPRVPVADVKLPWSGEAARWQAS